MEEETKDKMLCWESLKRAEGKKTAIAEEE